MPKLGLIGDYIRTIERNADVLVRIFVVGLGGLGVMCLPRDPRFAGSNLTEADGFIRT